MSEYKERDHRHLDQEGNYYCKHVLAMTQEGLHDKSDIAAELAHRDFEIDCLKDDKGRIEKQMCHLAAVHHLNAVKIFEASPLEAALSRIEELEAELSDWQRYCGIILREQRSTDMNKSEEN
ncbi:hypothetical protein SYK_07170 [Pseudodesulfovibrio nedwellii]|uniref:Uncharacterized protein n=1 Tax=Pseudodesulfovibrio nedwellii TaxID=2973072 RepID=A0ABM8AYE0_9BACT|nr:hypothetical protein [Pseudodesulfovibrio nedwellii]BDQ36357.1 hypothetical protein SYK_07170 [Pseudodesulfovibrio nedwellii]